MQTPSVYQNFNRIAHAVAIIFNVLTVFSNSALAAPPPNDNFANAEVIAGDSATLSIVLSGSTGESGEPNSCTHSVWYRWTSDVTGQAKFSEVPHDYFGAASWMTVLTGSSLGGLSEVAVYQGRQEYYTVWSVQSGNTYYLQSCADDTTITPVFQFSATSNPTVHLTYFRESVVDASALDNSIEVGSNALAGALVDSTSVPDDWPTQNLRVQYVLPTGVTYVGPEVQNAGCTQSGQNITCPMNSGVGPDGSVLLPAHNISYTFPTIIVTSSTPGSYDIQANLLCDNNVGDDVTDTQTLVVTETPPPPPPPTEHDTPTLPEWGYIAFIGLILRLYAKRSKRRTTT